MDKLEAISPIDGRYRRHTEPLTEYFSEKALIKNRIVVEGEYFISLSKHPEIKLREFSKEEETTIKTLYNLSLEDAKIVKDIEVKGYKNLEPTNHDVKAVEYFMKEKLKQSSLNNCLEWIHFALTSEDINNIAYALMIIDGLEKVVLPELTELNKKLEETAKTYKIIPMLARTHGQSASPTTAGKEFKVYSARLERQIEQIEKHEILAKLNGATGNYNAHIAAYPKVDWIKFTTEFINSFNENRKIKLKSNLITTQIEPHDTYAELFDIFKRANTILIDFSQDIWRYISDDWIKQKPKKGEVGSSTMPHKINPIDFENAEGNLGMANALFEYFSRKLPISRLQRDLSDSTVERNFGVALGHSLIAYKSLLKGMEKTSVNEKKVVEELEKKPEIIAEAMQTILRRESAEMPYEKLKDLTRGKEITINTLHKFVEEMEVSEEIKTELKKITPTNYTGIADIITEL